MFYDCRSLNTVKKNTTNKYNIINTMKSTLKLFLIALIFSFFFAPVPPPPPLSIPVTNLFPNSKSPLNTISDEFEVVA